MKNMDCLKCLYEWEGSVGDNCPKCGADSGDVIDKSLSLCESCGHMTYTIKGICGKCKKSKAQTC